MTDREITTLVGSNSFQLKCVLACIVFAIITIATGFFDIGSREKRLGDVNLTALPTFDRIIQTAKASIR